MPFGGPNYAATWTMPDIFECDWIGSACDLGTVVGFDLEDADIHGPIPDDLGLLTGLTELVLRRNALTGIIPSSLVALTALTVLDVGGYHFERDDSLVIRGLDEIAVLEFAEQSVGRDHSLVTGGLDGFDNFVVAEQCLSATARCRHNSLTFWRLTCG
jgi:hypothetical protein